MMGAEPLGLLNLGLLLGPACVLLAVQRVAYRRNESGSPLHALAWCLLWLGAAGPLTAIFGVLSLLAGPIIFALVLMLVDRFRTAEHRALVAVLASSAERGASLADAARSYAAENPGDTGFRALVFAETLELGAPVAEAARRAQLRLATGIRLALALAEQGGSLAAALRGQLAGAGELDGLLRSLVGRVYYCYLFLATWLVTFSFVNLKIMPIYRRMFGEFGLPLPELTQSMMAWSDVVNSGPLLLVQGVLWLASAVGLLLLFLAFVGWLWRDLPFLRRWFWQYDAAVVLRALAAQLRSGHTLPDGVARCAEHYPRGSVRRRLQRAARTLQQGGPWVAALASAGLIGGREAAVLTAAQCVGNTAWALEEIADMLLRRLVYRTTVLLQFVTPLLVLVFGVITAFYAVAVFSPLLALIQALT